MRRDSKTAKECDKAIIAISRGDKEALSVIYHHYGKLICSVARSIVKTPEDAEDVLQETMLCIVSHAGAYRGNTNPAAWVLAIARNCARKLINAGGPKDALSLDDGDAPPADLPHTAEDGSPEQLALISDALGTLSADERMIVKLKIHVGLTHREIASVMDIDPEAAKKRYQRAIEKLKRYYKE